MARGKPLPLDERGQIPGQPEITIIRPETPEDCRAIEAGLRAMFVENAVEAAVGAASTQSATIGDYITARGAIFDAAATFVDWEKLHNHEPGAISEPGLILLEIAERMRRADR